MSDVSVVLSEKVNDIKNQLILGLKPDDLGRYAVSESKFLEAIRNIFECFLISKNNLVDPEEIYNFDKDLFLFKNLKINLRWKLVLQEFQSLSHGNHYRHNTKKECFQNIIFENCLFDSLIIDGKYDNFIDSLILRDCSLSEFLCKLPSLNMGHIKKLIVSNCDILILRFDGHSPNFSSPINFSNCNPIVNIYAEENVFNQVCFENCVFDLDEKMLPKLNQVRSLITFVNSRFESTTSFKGCIFHSSPKFHGTKFHSDTSFQKSKFLDIKSPEAIGDYRVLKQAMHDLGAEHDAMNFHALEMAARRKTVLPFWLNIFHPEWAAAISSLFLRITNNYGRNYWLPFLWLFGFTVLFAYIYYKFDYVGCNEYNFDRKAELWQRELCNFKNPEDLKVAIVYSLQRSLGPVSLLIDNNVINAKTGTAKFLTVIQTFLSSIYWFIIIIQLRRQFKL